MNGQPKSDIKLEKERIDSIEEQIKENAQKILKYLFDALLKTNNALLFNLTKSDEDRDRIVIHNSALMRQEKIVVEAAVCMVETLVKFVRIPYERQVFQQPDVIPTGLNSLGTHWEYFSVGFPRYTSAAERLAVLSSYNASASIPMIQNCCDLVKGACEVETNIITKNQWELLGSNHPDGIVGHVYDVLLRYHGKRLQEGIVKPGERNIAEEFKAAFRERTNKLQEKANNLWIQANNLWGEAKNDETSQVAEVISNIEETLAFLGQDAVEDSSLKVIEDVIRFLEKKSCP